MMSFNRRTLLKVIVLGDSGWAPTLLSSQYPFSSKFQYSLYNALTSLFLLFSFISRVGKTSLMNQYPSFILGFLFFGKDCSFLVRPGLSLKHATDLQGQCLFGVPASSSDVQAILSGKNRVSSCRVLNVLVVVHETSNSCCSCIPSCMRHLVGDMFSGLTCINMRVTLRCCES